MRNSAIVPDLDDLRSYMQSVGWQECAPGPRGSLWLKGGHTVGVPSDAHADHALIKDLIKRIALAERATEEEVADKSRYYRVDITHLRAINDFAISDSIPLEAASTILSSAHKMLRAVGTTARGERSEIGRNFSTLGDKVAENSRIGHTEQGSYIIPLLVRLPSDSQAESLFDGTEFEHFTQVEPFERRVMRTFALSLAAVEKVLVEPARMPTLEQLLAVVERGVSSEFCDAVAKVLAEKSVAEFEAKFNWAPAVKISSMIPSSVTIDADAEEIVKEAASRLRINRIEPTQTFSGQVIGLQHADGEPSGWITVAASRNGRMSKIRVQLSLDQYYEAVSWHRASRPALVEGRIERDRSNRFFVANPVRCDPLDELPGL